MVCLMRSTSEGAISGWAFIAGLPGRRAAVRQHHRSRAGVERPGRQDAGQHAHYRPFVCAWAASLYDVSGQGASDRGLQVDHGWR
jgi:hypothetical protein